MQTLGTQQLGTIWGAPEQPQHSIEAGICRLIGDSVATPIVTRRDQNTSYPVIVYETENLTYGNYLVAKDGTGDLTLHLTIYSKTRDDLDRIGREIRDVLDHFTGQAWDRKVLHSFHEQESDECGPISDGSPVCLYARTQIYQIAYLDKN